MSVTSIYALVFALLLLGCATALWRKEKAATVPAIGISALVLLAALFRSSTDLFASFALGIYLGWLVSLLRAARRRRPARAIRMLMLGLSNLAYGHYYKWTSDEDFAREYQQFVLRFKEEGCDVALEVHDGADGMPEIRVMVTPQEKI